MVIETSHAIADVEGESGISEPEDWVRVYRKKHAGDEPPLQLSERARLRELEREVRELRMKADFLQSRDVLRGGARERPGSYAHVRIAGDAKIRLSWMEVPAGKRHRQAARWPLGPSKSGCGTPGLTVRSRRRGRTVS
jgi:transposase